MGINKMTWQEKVQRDNLKCVKLKRIPFRDNKIRPIFHICGVCHKNPVTDHHFLCNKCWKEKKLKGGKNNGIKRSNA